MKLRLCLLIAVFGVLVSCKKSNPIIFKKESNENSVQIELDTNKTFKYTAKGSHGAAFNETGTYEIQDSVLILKFRFKEYSYGCMTIPLQNDTLLICNHNGNFFLYPVLQDFPKQHMHFTKEQLMDKLLREYSKSTFGNFIGILYFGQKQGDISLIYKGTSKISPYYDARIAKK